jgi:CubicO group peptidase (beta-lactamase class C family)
VSLVNELEARRPQLHDLMLQYQMPAMVLAVAIGNAEPHSIVFVPNPDQGGAAYIGLPEDSLFAIASVTKLATALGVLRLVADGLLDLDLDIATWIPTSRSAVPGVTLRRILTHTAGLPYEVPLPPGQDWDTYYVNATTNPAPGAVFSYSIFGYDLAGAIIQTVSGWPYSKLIQGAVLEPIGAEGYFGWEPRLSTPRTGYFANVYNPNDLRLLGKPSGGLLATAEACVRLVRAYAWPPPALEIPGHLLAMARQNQVGGLHAEHNSLYQPLPPWGLGPELRGPSQAKTLRHYTPSAAADMSFGHYGASGSLAWCDPHRDLSWAILSVRTTGFDPWHYPAWRRIGDLIYDAAAAAVDG